MFDLIDSLIATITVVLLLSLIVQSIQQIAKQVFHMKSKLMERELMALLTNTPYKRTWKPQAMQFTEAAEQHPEAKQLVDKIRNKLSGFGYNDAGMLEGMNKDTFFRIAGDLFDTAELEQRDRSSLSQSEKDEIEKKARFLEKARWDIEQWYELTMTSFKDHYERRMKMWAFLMGAAVVVWLNANIFDIYKEFSTNRVLRDSAVKIGERLAATPKDSLIVAKLADGSDSVQYVPDSLAFKAIQTHIKFIDSTVNAQSFQLMRWNTASGTPLSWNMGVIFSAIWGNILGWLGMTLLVGLGAPFWYDILKTIVGLKERARGTVQGGGQSSSNIERERLTQEGRTPPPPPPASGETPAYG